MSFKDPIILVLLLGGSLLLHPVECCSSLFGLEGSNHSAISFDTRTSGKTILDGYTDVTNYEDGFIAVGSNGQIDRIFKTGEINNRHSAFGAKFNCVLTRDKLIIAAGDDGILLISNDNGKFEKINSGTDRTINSLVWFNSKLIAGADKGEILIGNTIGELKRIQLNLKGDVVSVSANAVFCFGVTNAGEIIHSTDGENWNIFDFNQEYKGFYKTCYFSKVLVTERSIAVTGVNDDGVPVFLLSNKGKVWSERALSYKNEQGIQEYPEGSMNDIFYDQLRDQFYLVCDDGKLLILPSCSQCNKQVVLSANSILGIAGNGDTIMVVGDSFYKQPINLDESVIDFNEISKN